MSDLTNIVLAGLGGQGVLKACEIVAEVAFRSGLDVKKAEVHGMSRRGGSVACDVRFGERVWSPMVPAGECDYLIALSPEAIQTNSWRLRPGATIIDAAALPAGEPKEKRALNVALLGALSRLLPFPESAWLDALFACLPEKHLPANVAAFQNGRVAQQPAPSAPQRLN